MVMEIQETIVISVLTVMLIVIWTLVIIRVNKTRKKDENV